MYKNHTRKRKNPQRPAFFPATSKQNELLQTPHKSINKSKITSFDLEGFGLGRIDHSHPITARTTRTALGLATARKKAEPRKLWDQTRK